MVIVNNTKQEKNWMIKLVSLLFHYSISELLFQMCSKNLTIHFNQTI